MARGYLELLLAGATRAELRGVVTAAEASGAAPDRVAGLRRDLELALQVHEEILRQRSREAELSALYDTAGDLTAIRDLDPILAAIVRRARQLLHADMTYLSLNDETEGASYMRVTDGALTQEFRTLRLPLGTGLLGLVAQTGAPYFTEDYQADARFVHREFIDSAVAGEQIRAILGVPLIVDGVVIGALLAVHRSVRRFPASEVALLTSFAAHAAVALENARLFEQARAAAAAADEANDQLLARSRSTERAAHAHDRLTDVLMTGGGVVEVGAVLAGVLGGVLAVYDAEGRLIAGEPGATPAGFDPAVASALASGHCVSLPAPAHTWLAVAAARDDHLGTLVLQAEAELSQSERRTLERGALVTALVLLFARTQAEAEERVRGELLVDLLSGRGDPGRVQDRARRQGADLDQPLVVALAEVEGCDRQRAARSAASLGRELEGLGGEHEGRAVVVAPERSGSPVDLGQRLAQRLTGRGGTATVGVSAADPGVEGARSGWGEAGRCLDTMLTLGRRGEVSDPAGLGVSRLLLGDNGPGQLDDFVDRTLGPILTYDAERGSALRQTLDAWFDAGGTPRATAERLHVHPNTVTQRLDRVTVILGEQWREPARSLDLQLALRIQRLRGAPVTRAHKT